MTGPNLSEWALKHRAFMVFCMILAVLAGLRAYFSLGQSEDPAFTVKTMVVRAYLPGAALDETIRQLTDRLEKKLQETPRLHNLKSYTLAGQCTIMVTLKDSTDKKDVPEYWYQVRKKVGDLRPQLPEETVGPFFDDEFGETYGIIYAFTSDGFSHRELKDHVERARDELLRVPDVAKVTDIGFQDERFYVEFSPRRLARLGLGRGAIISAIRQQNALAPSGTVETGRERVAIEVSGRFLSEDDLAAVPLHAGGRTVRLGDIAEVRRAPADPPQPLFRYNGRDAVGLGVSMTAGGDVLRLEKNLAKTMAALQAELPVGVETHLVSNQPQVVREAVAEFMEALIEAVAIVLGISFLSLGLRAGAVVACSIPLVLAIVFVGMEICGIDLQRVSLGALIIALGLLVDDAMITVENMVARIEEGRPLHEAATYAYTATAFPMLTGTLVTVFGFIPIGLSKSSAGEYTFSMFAVVGIALMVSWFVAVLFAPVIGVRLLKPRPGGAPEPAPGRIARCFHRALLFAMRHPKSAVAATLALFALAGAAFPLIPQQFFPPSDRPELLVDMTLRQGVSVRAAEAASRRLDEVLKDDPDVDHWSAYVGRGAIRFYLPLDEQLQNDFFAQTVVVAKDLEARDRLRARLQKTLADDFPELLGRVGVLELGPPVGWPVQYRVSGPDKTLVHQYARRVADIMAESPALSDLNMNWGTQARKLSVRIRQDEARRMGLSSADVAQALYAATSGVTATRVRDGIRLVDVVLRADEESRTSIEELRLLDIPLPGGGSAPLAAVAEIGWDQDWPLVWRRDRLPTITVQADIRDHGIMPAAVAAELKGRMDALAAELPPGYGIATGGTVEESAKSQASVAAALPLMAFCMLLTLMAQLGHFGHLALVVSVAPLGLIGVVFGLLLTGQPLGFVALLGVVALVGMIIRNSVILVHQIDREKEAGHSDWEAVERAATTRFRPIMLTAVAAILGMLPIAPTVFWGPMANAIMGGLAVATALTLLFLPACYVLCFGIEEPKRE